MHFQSKSRSKAQECIELEHSTRLLSDYHTMSGSEGRRGMIQAKSKLTLGSSEALLRQVKELRSLRAFCGETFSHLHIPCMAARTYIVAGYR